MLNNTILFRRANNLFYHYIISLSALLVGGLIFFILFFLAYEAAPFFSDKKLELIFSSTGWFPTEGQFNFWPMLVSSFAVSLMALAISLPISLLFAIFINYYSSTFAKVILYRFLEVIAGIPSVIFGLWGLVSLIPFLQSVNLPGTSILTASLVLFIMITPTTCLLICSQFKHFPRDLMKASLSLGLSKENLLLKIVIPWSKKGIIAATILGFGRAIGETVAVLMVSGNIVQVPQSIFSPIRTMTANIALEMGYAMEFHRSSLFVCGLILCLVVAFFIGFLNTEEVKAK